MKIACKKNSGGGSYEEYRNIQTGSTSARSHTIDNVSVGDKLLVLLFSGSSSTRAYNTYDGATCTGGTITKINNLFPSGSGNSFGTFYQIDCTSTSVTITHPSTNNYCNVFRTE